MDDKKSDHGIDEKIADTIGNICTILGGALLLYPLIDKATKTIIPEMQKLTARDDMKELLPGKEKQPEQDDGKHYPEHGEPNCD